MSTSQFNIRIDNDGNVVITQTTTMTVEAYLLQAGQIYQFQTSIKGEPHRAPFKSIAEQNDGQK